MTKLDTEMISRTMKDIQERRQEGSSIEDVLSLAELSANTLRLFFRSSDRDSFNDVSAASDYIMRTKRQISRLKHNNNGSSLIEDNIKELREVIKTTETATDQIMEQAEEILSLKMDSANPDQYKNDVMNHITAIFEACSFQDLSGQRIQRVILALNKIENRLDQLTEVLNLNSANESDSVYDMTENETDEERRQRELLLHGPQNDGEGIGQSFVDAIFAIENKRRHSQAS